MSTITHPSFAEAGLAPPFALKVGLVGNRRFGKRGGGVDPELAAASVRQVTVACEEVWTETLGQMDCVRRARLPLTPSVEPAGALESEAPVGSVADFFAPGPARLHILTGLAAGVDQLGARAALRLADRGAVHAGTGAGITVQLEGIMPFPEADFPGLVDRPRPEFTAGEAGELHALAAACVQTVRLDGVYGSPDDPRAEESRNRAYRQARDMILQNGDLLVAVFDPAAAAGLAGTLETLRLALANGMPVVAVLVGMDGPRVAVYRLGAELPADFSAAGDALDGKAWRTILQQTLTYLLAPPHTMAPGGESDHQKAQRQRACREAAERLGVFLGRREPGVLFRSRLRSSAMVAGWRFVTWLGGRFSRPHGFVRYRVPLPPATRDALTVPPYQRASARAEELSGLYMAVYRGAFTLAFLLAGVAVAIAVGTMVVAFLTANSPPLLLVAALGGMKIAILLTLLWLERTGRQEHWQECAAEYRYLAELLRPMQWLAPLGAIVPAVELPAQYAAVDPRQGWMHWFLRATARAVPSVCAVPADPAEGQPRAVEFFREDARRALTDARDVWLEGQRSYHAGAAQRNHAIENGLERVAKGLLYAVFFCAVAALLLEVVGNRTAGTRYALPEWTEPAVVILTALAAALPAFVAALGGIIFQSEAKRLEMRSEAMFHGLQVQQQRLTNTLETLRTAPLVQGGTVRDAAQTLRALAGLLIAEAGDWKALYQTQEIRAG